MFEENANKILSGVGGCGIIRCMGSGGVHRMASSYRAGRRGLAQEDLKIIGCVTMVIDHLGVLFFPWVELRIIGRIAFPIFCFLIAQGVAHTRDLRRYLDRLGSCAILSELPYDLAFYGGICDDRCNVMVTLFIGAAVLAVLQSDRAEWLKVVTLLVGALVARWLGADYGALGVLMIVLFSFELPGWVNFVLLGSFFFFSGSATVVVFQWVIPIQMFGLLALVPIAFYQEEKRWYAPWIKWGFYLFYPVHLLVLLVVRGTMMA